VKRNPPSTLFALTGAALISAAAFATILHDDPDLQTASTQRNLTHAVERANDRNALQFSAAVDASLSHFDTAKTQLRDNDTYLVGVFVPGRFARSDAIAIAVDGGTLLMPHGDRHRLAEGIVNAIAADQEVEVVNAGFLRNARQTALDTTGDALNVPEDHQHALDTMIEAQLTDPATYTQLDIEGSLDSLDTLNIAPDRLCHAIDPSRSADAWAHDINERSIENMLQHNHLEPVQRSAGDAVNTR